MARVGDVVISSVRAGIAEIERTPGAHYLDSIVKLEGESRLMRGLEDRVHDPKAAGRETSIKRWKKLNHSET